jgi:hypothetical protein
MVRPEISTDFIFLTGFRRTGITKADNDLLDIVLHAVITGELDTHDRCRRETLVLDESREFIGALALSVVNRIRLIRLNDIAVPDRRARILGQPGVLTYSRWSRFCSLLRGRSVRS